MCEEDCSGEGTASVLDKQRIPAPGAEAEEVMAMAARRFWLRAPCALVYLLLFMLLTTATYMGIDWYLADPARVTSHSVDLSMEVNVDFHYEMAGKLNEIIRQIKWDMKDNIKPNILLELNKITSQLDPRYALSTGELLTDSQQTPDACGEIFNGSLFGYPWYRTGFVEAPNCDKSAMKPLSDLITMLFLNRRQNLNKTVDLLQNIQIYDSSIKIILASTASTENAGKLKSMFKNVRIIQCDDEDLQHPGKLLNIMVQRVDTPYTLIARDVFFFNDLARLERQIFVISSTNVVGVAGGAYRNESGYWKVGCYLSKLQNYVLKYTAGYKYSALDCMLCDHLEGPFVAKTSVLRNVPFNKDLFYEVLFEDWFLKVKQNNILAMNCPDVMYFRSGPVEGVRDEEKLQEHLSWLGLAKEWQVDQIQYPSRISINFTCKELKITCDSTRWFKAFLIPTCCMEQVKGALKTLDTFATEKGLEYEIEAGTLLGAVKLSNFLPWDKDGDITFLIKDYDTFYQNANYFSERGYSLSRFRNSLSRSYFRLNTPDIILEMWGSKRLSTFELPTEMWEYPTRVKMNGLWIRGEWNPGLFVRNRYGPDYLKHVQHWNLMNMIDSWQIYKPGSWKNCPKRAHHACLDIYPTDGSENLLPP